MTVVYIDHTDKRLLYTYTGGLDYEGFVAALREEPAIDLIEDNQNMPRGHVLSRGVIRPAYGKSLGEVVALLRTKNEVAFDIGPDLPTD